MRAVVDARGLQEQTIGRIEQLRQGFNGGQVACEVDIRKRGRDDERGDQQRDDHPHAEKSVARAGGMVALFGESSFTPGAQDGSDLGHGSIVKDEG